MNKFILYVFLLASFLVSCKPGTPKQYIQPDELEEILYDMHLAQGMTYQADDMSQHDYNVQLYYDAVLSKHGLTQAEFDSSMVYYFKRSDRLETIYKRVVKRLNEEAMNLGASEGELGNYRQFSASGDTANVWTNDVYAVLMPYPMRNRLDFVIKADSTFRKGDTYALNLTLDFHYQSGTKEAEGCLLLVYDNDSVACRTHRLSFSGFNQLRLPADDNHVVKEIRGYVYLAKGGEESTTLKLLFIRDIQLIRFRKKEVQPMPVDSLSQQLPATQEKPLESDSAETFTVDTVPSRFGRVLPAGGRQQPMKEKAILPKKDINLKNE